MKPILLLTGSILSRYVLPSLSRPDTVDRRLSNAKHAGKSVSRHTDLKHRNNLGGIGVCQFSADVLFATRNRLRVPSEEVPVSRTVVSPSFVNTILGVVLVSTKKKVVGVNTRTNVALVANQKPFRYWPVMDLPRDAMGELGLKVSGAELPVPVYVFAASPKPTGISFPNLVKEKLFSWANAALHVAVAFLVVFDFRWESAIRLTASGTVELNGFYGTITFGHGVTSETGCVMSRLVRALQRSFGPFSFYHERA